MVGEEHNLFMPFSLRKQWQGLKVLNSWAFFIHITQTSDEFQLLFILDIDLNAFKLDYQETLSKSLSEL